MAARVAELTAARVPFVHATVVRAQEPTSAQRGRRRGRCWPTARSRASSAGSAPRSRCGRRRSTALRDGETAAAAGAAGRRARRSRSRRARRWWSTRACPAARWRSSCEPMLPAPLLGVVGGTPIADALARWPGRSTSSVDARAGSVRRARPRSWWQARAGRAGGDPGRAGRRGRLHRAGGQPRSAARRCWTSWG